MTTKNPAVPPYIIDVNLPVPSDALLAEINNLVANINFDANTTAYRTLTIENTSQNPTGTIDIVMSGSDKMAQTDELTAGQNRASFTTTKSQNFFQLARAQYDQFFPGVTTSYGIGVYKNLNPGTPAVWPPHGDRPRTAGIHYVVNAGGDNHLITFYDRRSTYGNPNIETLAFGDTANLGNTLGTFSSSTGDFFGMDVQQYHGMTGIDDTRILMYITFRGPLLSDLVTEFGNIFVS
jgi:hypothetical protein